MVLLIINHLLVVVAGTAERPAKVIDRPFAHGHSPDCQLTHTPQLAYFDDCNAGAIHREEKRGAALTQAVAALVDPHALYEHLHQGFIRETLSQEAPAAPPEIAATRAEQA